MTTDTIYRIKSSWLKAKGDKIEGFDRKRIEARLRWIRQYQDPHATLLTIPVSR